MADIRDVMRGRTRAHRSELRQSVSYEEYEKAVAVAQEVLNHVPEIRGLFSTLGVGTIFAGLSLAAIAWGEFGAEGARQLMRQTEEHQRGLQEAQEKSRRSRKRRQHQGSD